MIKYLDINLSLLNMNCKNCNTDLITNDNYCKQCGAKVIKERITLKNLFAGLFASLGWDNRFWLTFWHLLTKPQVVFEKYLNGTRKMYSAPFTFFAIIITISVIAISFCSDEMVELSLNPFVESVKNQDSIMTNVETESISQQNPEKLSTDLDRQVFFEKMLNFIFKYYYYINFLFLPLFAIIAFLVFGKPDNFAEHLIINAYLHGLIGFFGLLLLALTLATNISGIYNYGQYAMIFAFYIYAYQKYRKYSFKQLIFKILRFFAVITVLAVAFMLLVVLITIVVLILKH